MKVRVVAALIESAEEPNRYLVQQRLPNKARPLLWEFPGGKVERGETDEEALIREGKEELGVDLAVGEHFFTHEHAYPEIIVQLVLYRAKIVKGRPQTLMARELQFLTPQEMLQKTFCPADVPVLQALNGRDR
jgi:8-oxo-dGTP diphosphatase